jgi:threonine/homoserine/homoserine lactone efflux protein
MRMMRRLLMAMAISALAGTLPTPLDFIQFGAAMVMLWLAYQDLKKL